MSRAIIAPRVLIPPRAGRLPSWLKGRASLYFDPTDDLVAGTIPADLTGAGAWTILGRLRPATFHTATDRGAVSFGTNAAAQGAFLGQVISGSKPYIGGGLIGTTLADSRVASPSEWSDCMIRYAGGAGGALTLVVNGRSTAGVATGNITGTNASLGRLLAAGTCFGGRVSDARILSRAISDAEYDAWRLGTSAPVTTRRRWTCENPGYGTTCHEEIGNTEDAITGATWSSVVPFRRRRVVEDVAAAFRRNLAVAEAIIPHNAAFDAGVGSWGIMGWRCSHSPIVNTNIVSKFPVPAWPLGPGWLCYNAAAGGFQPQVIFADGATSKGISGRAEQGYCWSHLAFGIDRSLGLGLLYQDAKAPTTVSLAGFGAVDSVADLSFARLIGLLTTGVITDLNDWILVVGRMPTWAEIEAHYYDGIEPTAPAGAVQISWGMREGAGTTVASSPAGYNGTLSAASWTTSTRSKKRAAA
jgi:hypothetical protein